LATVTFVGAVHVASRLVAEVGATASAEGTTTGGAARARAKVRTGTTFEDGPVVDAPVHGTTTKKYVVLTASDDTTASREVPSEAWVP